jgi:hypothetical protein
MSHPVILKTCPFGLSDPQQKAMYYRYELGVLKD